MFFFYSNLSRLKSLLKFNYFIKAQEEGIKPGSLELKKVNKGVKKSHIS